MHEMYLTLRFAYGDCKTRRSSSWGGLPCRRCSPVSFLYFEYLLWGVKMAAVNSSSVYCSKQNWDNLNPGANQCVSCADLKEEITRISNELKSAWEIIRSLQENAKENIGSTVPESRPKMASTWAKVQNRSKSRMKNNITIIPVANKFTPLENIALKSQQSNEAVMKSKVVIIGDNHARGCAVNLKMNLKNNIQVTGYVNPGSQIDVVVKYASS